MASHGNPEQKAKPVAATPAKAGKPWRVLSADGTSAPSIAMPRANTDLRQLLTGDLALCVRSRAKVSAVSAPLDGKVEPLDNKVEPLDADLSRVREAWPNLSQGVRTAILALIDAK